MLRFLLNQYSQLQSLAMRSQPFSKVVVAVIAFATVVTGASKKTGSTVEVDSIHYYVPPVSVSQLALGPEELKLAVSSGEDLIPLTVITKDFTTFDKDALKSLVDSYAAADDVFSPGFLQGTMVLVDLATSEKLLTEF